MIFTDQLNRNIEINSPPKRIISLVPSQTELLYDLGLKEKVVGITKFCIHPLEWFNTKPRIGGTKKIDFKKISELNPDLIIGNKEENERLQLEELMKHYPVWVSDIKNLEQAIKMINSIGELTNRKEKSTEINIEIIAQFKKLVERPVGSKIQTGNLNDGAKRVAYFIWKKPLIVAGKNTFINDMLMKCSYENAFIECEKRYPEISPGELQRANPEIILLSSEPYPFKEKHITEFQKICPGAKIILTDGELFSWYGSRLLKAPEYFLNLTGKIF